MIAKTPVPIDFVPAVPAGTIEKLFRTHGGQIERDRVRRRRW